MPLTDKNGGYYKALQFFYKANQMGLVDPTPLLRTGPQPVTAR